MRDRTLIDKSKIRSGSGWSPEWDHFPSPGLVLVLHTFMGHMFRSCLLLSDEDPAGDMEVGATGHHCFQANWYFSFRPHSPRWGRAL